MQEKYLYDLLIEYCASDSYPFHMPGHKRRLGGLSDPFSFDITEIDGFDNLHHAEGVLLEAEQRAARLYGAEETHFLVNGSTAGILCAIGACVPSGKILMARNSHKAAYHAVFLNRLEAVYLYPEKFVGEGRDAGAELRNESIESSTEDFPGKTEEEIVKEMKEETETGTEEDTEAETETNTETRTEAETETNTETRTEGTETDIRELYRGINGPINPEDVEQALEKDPDIRAVFVTSPTYDGVVSDIEKIALMAHRHGIPLIVDEAHGAHFGMHSMFPKSSVIRGADIVIHSLHKTLPSLTQTALLHVNGNLADRRRLRKLLGIYQSSSPSYVLMSSMDQCIRIIREQGPELFERFAENLNTFRASVKDLRVLRLIATDDPSKLLISAGASGLTGLELSNILREQYHLELEMAAGSYVLALTSVGDSPEGFRRLAAALLEIDQELWQKKEQRAESGWLELDKNQEQNREKNREESDRNQEKNREESDRNQEQNKEKNIEESDRNWEKNIEELDRNQEQNKEKNREETDRNQEQNREKNREKNREESDRNREQNREKNSTTDLLRRGNGKMETAAGRQQGKSRAEMTIFAAENAAQSRVKLEKSRNCISGEYVYLYPPGIPLVVPGERISGELLERMVDYKKNGYSLQGLEDYQMEYIWVVWEGRCENSGSVFESGE